MHTGIDAIITSSRQVKQPPQTTLNSANSDLFDRDTTVDAAWALSYLTDGDDNKIQAVVEAGVCARLVEMLSSGSIYLMIFMYTY